MAATNRARLIARGDEVPEPSRWYMLTDKQKEAAQLFAVGYNCQEVAQKRKVHRKAIFKQRWRIHAILGIHCAADLTLYCLKYGFITKTLGGFELDIKQLKGEMK